MEEEAHVEGLPDRAELLHQWKVEARKMFILKRTDDRLRDRDGASLDGVTRELAALDQYLRKDVERMLLVAAAGLLEVRRDERVVDFMQRAHELLTVPTAPLLASNEPADLTPRE